LILSWYFDIFKSALRFDIIMIFRCSRIKLWWIAEHQNIKSTRDFDIIMIFYWYYQVVFDISFVCHLILSNALWYIFHKPHHGDILILSWYLTIKPWWLQNIKTSNQLWDFENLILSRYFDIIKCYIDTSLVCQLAVIFCYCHDILRFKIKTIIITNVCCLVL